MKKIVLLIMLLSLITLVGNVLAMESENYQLDWFTPLTSGGGKATNSEHYAINYTVGQTAVRTSASTNYNVCLGYWCGGINQPTLYLPLILRNTS